MLPTLGWVGIGASALAWLLAFVLFTLSTSGDAASRLFTVVGNLTVSIALGGLLLLAYGRERRIDLLVQVTGLLLAVLWLIHTVLLIGGVALEGGFLRAVLVVSILAFLGVVLTPLLARLLAPRS